MATVYGNTILSAWRSVLVYTVSETPTTYTIRVTNCGAQCINNTYDIGGTGDSGCNFKETLTGMTSSATTYTTDFRYSGFYGTGIYQETMGLNCPFTKTINKTTSTQSVTVKYAVNISAFIRTKRSTGNGSSYGSYTSTATVTITIPALAKPTVSMDLQRAENDNGLITIVATVNSFNGDTINNITVADNGTTLYSNWTPALPYTMNSTSQNFTTTYYTQNENSIPFTIQATGNGGTSATITKKLTGAFYTIDIKGGGREIAFGAPATDDLTNYSHGLFKCGMAQRNYVEEITSNVTTTTGTYVNSNCYRVGNIVQLRVSFRNTGSTASGANIYVATLSSDVPAPICAITGSTYYGACALPFSFTTSKVLTVRNDGSSALTIGSDSSAQLGFTYITND